MSRLSFSRRLSSTGLRSPGVIALAHVTAECRGRYANLGLTTGAWVIGRCAKRRPQEPKRIPTQARAGPSTTLRAGFGWGTRHPPMASVPLEQFQHLPVEQVAIWQRLIFNVDAPRVQNAKWPAKLPQRVPDVVGREKAQDRINPGKRDAVSGLVVAAGLTEVGPAWSPPGLPRREKCFKRTGIPERRAGEGRGRVGRGRGSRDKLPAARPSRRGHWNRHIAVLRHPHGLIAVTTESDRQIAQPVRDLGCEAHTFRNHQTLRR